MLGAGAPRELSGGMPGSGGLQRHDSFRHHLPPVGGRGQRRGVSTLVCGSRDAAGGDVMGLLAGDWYSVPLPYRHVPCALLSTTY